MEYIISHDTKADMIVATASGKWNQQKDNELVREVRRTVSDLRVKNVLIDLRSLENIDLTTLRLYEHAIKLKQGGQEFETVSMKVAIVVSVKDEKDEANCKFFETTARNRGLPYMIFKDIDPAMEWLKGA
jgi:anti-anti-sigma regulatory factor